MMHDIPLPHVDDFLPGLQSNSKEPLYLYHNLQPIVPSY